MATFTVNATHATVGYSYTIKGGSPVPTPGYQAYTGLAIQQNGYYSFKFISDDGYYDIEDADGSHSGGGTGNDAAKIASFGITPFNTTINVTARAIPSSSKVIIFEDTNATSPGSSGGPVIKKVVATDSIITSPAIEVKNILNIIELDGTEVLNVDYSHFYKQGYWHVNSTYTTKNFGEQINISSYATNTIFFAGAQGSGTTTGQYAGVYDKGAQLPLFGDGRVGYRAMYSWTASGPGVYTEGTGLRGNDPADNAVPENGTMYQRYIPITYSVRFNANGGSGSMSDQVLTYDATETLNTCTFVPPSGKRLKGGDTSSAGTTAVYTEQQTAIFNLTTTQGATVNLYAVGENDTSLPFTSVKVGGNGISSTPYVKANGQGIEAWAYVKANDQGNLVYYPEYTYLNYIQLTGPAYINTGITPDVYTNIDATLAVNSTSGTTLFYGAAQCWGNNAIEGFLDASKGAARSGSSTGYSDDHTLYYSGSLNSQPKRYLYIGGASNRTWTLYDNNDTQLYTGTFAASSGSSITPNGPLYIGALNRTTDGVVYNDSSISGKLYGFRIYNTSGTTLRNFVPVIKNNGTSAGTYGLLDTQNNVFYTNANSSGTITGA